MRDSPRIFMITLTGFAAVILLFVVGVMVSVRRLDAVATTQLVELRDREREISIAEQLQQISDSATAAARGYLSTNDGFLRAKLQDAERSFDRLLRELRSHPVPPSGRVLVAAIEARAEAYRTVRSQLPPGDVPQTLEARARWFERELLPREEQLAAALDHLIRYEQDAILDEYRAARHEWREVVRWIDGMLVLSFLASLTIAWWVARVLSRAYRRTADALVVARDAISGRDELMGIVAHDLRNPIAAIVLRTSVARQAGLPEELAYHAQAIEQLAMRTEYIIRSMLDVAAIEEGRLTVSPGRWTPAGLVEESIALIERMAQTKGVRLEVEAAPPAASRRVRADRERLVEVLSNLFENAIRVSPPGSRVTIELVALDGHVRFSVTDSGPPIAKDNLDHVFDRFWQEGLGDRNRRSFGLFVAKGIIEAHGGQILAESDGQGMTISFTLPVAVAEKAVPSPAAAMDGEEVESDGGRGDRR